MHKLIFKTSLTLLTMSSFLEAAPLPPTCPPASADPKKEQAVLQAFCAFHNSVDPTWNCSGGTANITFSGSVTSNNVSCQFNCADGSSLSYSVTCRQ